MINTDIKNELTTTYNGIDLAKFVCSLFVVMIHVAPLGEQPDSSVLYYVNYLLQDYLARIAVPFFFVCSGFFLFKKTDLKHFSLEPTKRQALRIFRLYITWSLIYLPLAIRSFFRDEDGVKHAVILYIKNFIFNGSYTHLWYLNALIFAMALVSFLIYKKVNTRIIIIASVVAYMIGLLGQSWYGLIVPLRDIAPSLWNLLKIAYGIIGTTRDGLFEGFPFVCVGMIFAYYQVPISKKQSFTGFAVSLLLLLVEEVLLHKAKFIKDFDMYLFTLPVTFFAFSYVKQIKLTDREIYRKLRNISSLVFYCHLWVRYFVEKILSAIYSPLNDTFVRFVLTLGIAVIVSTLIVYISNIEKLGWVKKLYV